MTEHERHRPGHSEPEGEYEDKDVTPGESEVEAVGSYTDRDVTPGEQDRPQDEGEYTDHDESGTARQVGHEGSYTETAPERHHRGTTEERDDTHG